MYSAYEFLIVMHIHLLCYKISSFSILVVKKLITFLKNHIPLSLLLFFFFYFFFFFLECWNAKRSHIALEVILTSITLRLNQALTS